MTEGPSTAGQGWGVGKANNVTKEQTAETTIETLKPTKKLRVDKDKPKHREQTQSSSHPSLTPRM
jgi:hypothetical protein